MARKKSKKPSREPGNTGFFDQLRRREPSKALQRAKQKANQLPYKGQDVSPASKNSETGPLSHPPGSPTAKHALRQEIDRLKERIGRKD